MPKKDVPDGSFPAQKFGRRRRFQRFHTKGPLPLPSEDDAVLTPKLHLKNSEIRLDNIARALISTKK